MMGEEPSHGDPGPTSPKSDFFLKKSDLIRNKFVRGVHSNVSSDVIQITEDKALICLIENFGRLRERDAWKVPLGILITLVTVMITAAFQDRFYLSKETWTALGWISTFLAGGWLVRDLIRSFLGHGQGNPVTPRSIVAELKTITAIVPDGGR